VLSVLGIVPVLTTLGLVVSVLGMMPSLLVTVLATVGFVVTMLGLPAVLATVMT
jgi:hypothetical protein